MELFVQYNACFVSSSLLLAVASHSFVERHLVLPAAAIERFVETHCIFQLRSEAVLFVFPGLLGMSIT